LTTGLAGVSLAEIGLCIVETVAHRPAAWPRSAAARAKGEGSGLGLAIARSLAQGHGGDLIHLPGNPHGARFELILPVGGARRVSP
jgi:signal transduction histidine kinase